MIHMRGQASDYEAVGTGHGDARWRWGGPDGQTLAIYQELEDYFGGADEWHGAGGEIRVERHGGVEDPGRLAGRRRRVGHRA
jgi:choline dehydrogenase